MWVSLGQRGWQVRCLWKTIMGRHQITSWLYRTLLLPFSFLPIDWALFCLLIWSLTRTRRTDKDSRGPPVWQFRTANTNIQGQPPQQWQLNLYLYHNHITSNPSTPIFESETGLRSRGSSRLWKFKSTPQQRLTHFCASFFTNNRDVNSSVSHVIKPSHGITNIIQLTFQMWNPALYYRWVWSGAGWFRGGRGILWLSALSLSQCELPDTYCIVGAERLSGLDSERQRFCTSWKWIFVHRRLSIDLATVEN